MKIADQTGRVAIVTGSNTGIGEVSARELARAGAKVYLACRSTDRANAAADGIRAIVPNADLQVLPLDLSSFESIRAAAGTFLESGDTLDILMNNAGLAGPRGITADGFELTFGVNHLGHFLFTLLLLDRVLESAPSRIVNVSSAGHYRAKGIDWNVQRQSTPSLTGFPEYCVSKLANVLFTKELDKRLRDQGVTTYSLHPGGVASDIWERRIPRPIAGILKLFLISTEEGARTQLHCATAPGAAEQSGLYWDKSKPKTPSRLARNAELAAELWRRSLDWTSAPDYPR
jgi:retinol dehydrogenase-12